jgi:membrane fusion protein, multidrug efflux system
MVHKIAHFLKHAIILSVAIGLLSGMAWLVRGRSTKAENSSKPTPSIPVRVHRVHQETFEQVRSLSGLVESRYASDLAFRVGGKIESRLVNVGDRVKMGDVLFQLELQDYELHLQSAEADLASATATLKQATTEEQRMQSLRATRSVSADEYDRSLAAREVATARRTAAERAHALAKNRLAYTVLTAPADGIVTAIMAEKGQVVGEGRSVARLTQGEALEVVVGIPEKYVASLKSSSAQITFWSLPGVTIKGELRELAPISDPIARTYQARFSISDTPPSLQLGMSATLKLCGLEDEPAFSVPPTALVGRHEGFDPNQLGSDESACVWRIIDAAGHIEAVAVEVISFGEQNVIVRGSLKDGDEIVSAGVQKLDAGMTVQRWEELK